jgi:hypothetical protein
MKRKQNATAALFGFKVAAAYLCALILTVGGVFASAFALQPHARSERRGSAPEPRFYSSPVVQRPLWASNQEVVIPPVRKLPEPDSGLATVSTQEPAGYPLYMVHLQLASGDEQSLVVAAPPGGLQLELRDMTGDGVPNDLVLIPALLRWPLSVLVNDGHDHFTVAISGTIPTSAESGDQASSSPSLPESLALLYRGFRTGLAETGLLFLPKVILKLLLATDQTATNRMDQRSVLGRAPPSPATTI